MNRSISFTLFLFIILAFHSCLWDAGKEIEVNNKPFNNYDSQGRPLLSNTSELVILIPDIQNYTHFEQYNKILEIIIDRIIEINGAGYKVKAVVQVGDVTETNSPEEWKVAKKKFNKLDSVKINYILTTGNHDYGNSGITDSRQTYFNECFDFSNQSSFQQCYRDSLYENSLFEISIQGKPFQIIALEFGPRKKILEWVDKVIDKNKTSMLITHAYLFGDKERFNWKESAKSQYVSPYNYAYQSRNFGGEDIDVNDGEDLWQKLIYPHGNIRFVCCGHKMDPYIGNLISKNIQDKDVLQMLFNTQSFANGGDGWIQIFEFKNDKKTMDVKTYSCLYNEWNTSPTHQYAFIYD